MLCYGALHPSKVVRCFQTYFVKGYPRVEMIHGPTKCECEKGKCKCVSKIIKNKYYRHLDEGKLLVTSLFII